MTISEILLADFDGEATSTKRVLERVPEDKYDWKPHEKSMSLKGLARHVAAMPYSGLSILTTDIFVIGVDKAPALPDPASPAELVELSAGIAAELRTVLSKADDDYLQANWTLKWGDRVIASAPRHAIYRSMFSNHLIHHRGQLNVYLRLLDVKVPGIYGPSADEPFGG